MALPRLRDLLLDKCWPLRARGAKSNRPAPSYERPANFRPVFFQKRSPLREIRLPLTQQLGDLTRSTACWRMMAPVLKSHVRWR